ncbi:hypothetical protein B0H11DRAFT_2236897 [Mycena galericulata]|nr:hypothetical protein B0H11DRAFT_2236897 [Mycena galericulata]
MSQFHAVSHDLSKPADTFLQAPRALPAHMVQDKILSGLSSTYSPIITLLQAESPQRDVPSMINTINAWERGDLQRPDSVIKAARAAKVIDDANQGGAFACSSPHSSLSPLGLLALALAIARTSATVVALPGHFAQYCVSVMPDDVRHRITHDREQRAHTAEAERDPESADNPSNPRHVLPYSTFPLSCTSIPWTELFATHGFPPSAIAFPPDVDPGPSPPSPTLTTSSITSTPTKNKNKKKKKKKKSATANDIRSAFEAMSLKEEEDKAEYSV